MPLWWYCLDQCQHPNQATYHNQTPQHNADKPQEWITGKQQQCPQPNQMWACFQWHEKNNLLTLQPAANSNESWSITLSCLSLHPQPLLKLQLHTLYQYLGVHVSMNGDWKKEFSVFQTCNQKYLQVLNKCSLSCCKIKVIYRQCYLPMVTYPLPTSTIPSDKLNRNQSPPHF